MSATTDEDRALMEHLLTDNAKARTDIFNARIAEMERLHGPILELARPILIELFELHVAAFTPEGEDPRENVLAGVSLAVRDPRIYGLFTSRIERVRAGVVTEALRQYRTHGEAGYVPGAPLPVGRA